MIKIKLSKNLNKNDYLRVQRRQAIDFFGLCLLWGKDDEN